MSNWLQQIQTVLGKAGKSSSGGEGLSKMLAPVHSVAWRDC